MESFIGLDVEQSRSKISLHLDAYIKKTLNIYKEHQATKMIRPKSTPMQQDNVLTSADALENWKSVPQLNLHISQHS